MRLSFFECGYTEQLEIFAERTGRLRRIRFPVSIAMLEHPRFGIVLFDAGYSTWNTDPRNSFFAKLYGLITPVHLTEKETAVARLAERGIKAEDVGMIIVSHFHADHVGGLRDFPRATFVADERAVAAVRGLAGFAGMKQAFIPELLPADFFSRLKTVAFGPEISGAPELGPFGPGYDLFGDQSAMLIPLPGHAPGQIGLYVREATDCGPDGVFAVADAAYSIHAVRELVLPHSLTLSLIGGTDSVAYRNTLAGLHKLSMERPGLRIVPSHCEHTLSGLVSR